MRAALAFVAVFALSSPARAAVSTTQLPNGLVVHVEEDSTTSDVAVSLTYRVGARDDPDGYQSLAHLVEHLMFQGSTNVPEDGFFWFLEMAGATTIQGTTSWDETSYIEVLPASRLQTALWLESDRMGFLLGHLGTETLRIQKEVVRNEWRQRGGGFVANAPLPVLAKGLYPKGHPYRLGLANLESQLYGEPDLDAIGEAEVAWFFQQWYQPANATLAIVGNVSNVSVQEMVKQHFGPIRSAVPLPTRATGAPVFLTSERRIEVLAPTSKDQLMLAWPMPPRDDPDMEALEVLARYLRVSPMVSRLRDGGIVSSLRIGHHQGELGSLFIIQAIALRGHTTAGVLKIIDEELDALRTGGIAEDDAQRAQRHALVRLLRDRDELYPRALRLSKRGEPLDAAIRRMRRVTKADVDEALQHWIIPRGRVVMTIEEDRQAPLAGRVTVHR